MVFVSQTTGVFLPAAQNCSVSGTQFKKKKKLALKKALAIASAFRLMGPVGLGSNAKVEFELYPTSESKAAQR